MSFDPGSLLSDIDLGQLEALVETMYLAADADGEFSDEERDHLASSIRDLVRGSPHEAGLTADKLAAMLDQMRERLKSAGRDERLKAVRQALGDRQSCKAAFGLSVRVTAADGIVRTTEREFIMDLADALDVDRDEAADLVRELTRA